MLSSAAGKRKAASAEQYANASSPMCFTLSGSSISRSASQERNAPSATVVGSQDAAKWTLCSAGA